MDDSDRLGRDRWLVPMRNVRQYVAVLHRVVGTGCLLVDPDAPARDGCLEGKRERMKEEEEKGKGEEIRRRSSACIHQTW